MLNGHTLKNTFLVADFDRTITEGRAGTPTAFGVFPRAPGSSDRIQQAARELFEKYYPLEISKEISEEERAYFMKEWNEKVMELLGECIDEKQLERILEYARNNIVIRDGIKEALQELGSMGIPIIVFSAGVSNVIQEVLNYHNIPYSGIHSNELGFREGRLQLINQGVYIGKKGWNSLPIDLHSRVITRTHKIILGDSLDDLNMGDPERKNISIGFLNSEQIEKGRRESYKKAFTHVVESDTSDDGVLEKIIEQLKKGA